MDFEERTLKSECVYSGKVVSLYVDDVEIAGGKNSFREVVKHSGGVVIAALKDKDTVLLVKQFRYPLKQTVYEFPAGKLEPAENPDFAAKRELEEETGYRANNWKSLGYINTSPGFCDEKLYLYLAEDLKFVGAHPDEGENIKCCEFSLKELKNMITDGTINDAKTICAFLRAFYD